MKKLIFIFLGLSLGFSQNSNILNLLNDQVDAYNKMDVNRLVDNVTDDFKYYGLTADTLLLETTGKAAFRKSMEAYYKNRTQAPNSSIKSYTIVGNKISFKETVRYTNKNGKILSNSAMGIYQIRDGKIARAWYFYD